MPLKKIRLRNFKCFKDSGDIPITPLTLIYGRNNTGKSTILQTLLLLRQTLDSPSSSGPRLNLHGPLYTAGTYADVVHRHQTKENLRIDLDVSLPGKRKPAEVELEFMSDEPRMPLLARFRVASSQVGNLEIRRGQGAGGPYHLVINGRDIGLQREANFQFAVESFLPRIGEGTGRPGRPDLSHERSRGFAREVVKELEKILRELRAVGAFRSPPERRYEYHGQAAAAVDAIGKNVVSALIGDSTRRTRRGELLRNVNQWLRKVGKVRVLPLKRISRAARLFEVRLKDLETGGSANFADVGFGIGQAFPVIVEGLRSNPDDLFLVQEPEIHLHPDAQLAMGDFLLSLAADGRIVIAETHSEGMLLRIRHKMVSRHLNGGTKTSLDPEDLTLIQVAKDDQGRSTARTLKVDELGQVTNWPKGFMEETTEERMQILEATAKAAEKHA